MKLLTLLAAGILLAGVPAQADTTWELIDRMSQFCDNARWFNATGYSMAPGSPASSAIALKAGVSTMRYRVLWRLAQESGLPECKSLW